MQLSLTPQASEDLLVCSTGGDGFDLDVLPLTRTVGELGPADCFLQPRQFWHRLSASEMKEHRESSSNRSESSKENLSPSSHSANISSITSTVALGFSAFSDGAKRTKVPEWGKVRSCAGGGEATQLRGLPLGRTHARVHQQLLHNTQQHGSGYMCPCVIPVGSQRTARSLTTRRKTACPASNQPRTSALTSSVGLNPPGEPASRPPGRSRCVDQPGLGCCHGGVSCDKSAYSKHARARSLQCFLSLQNAPTTRAS